jgi:hypothetical protein
MTSRKILTTVGAAALGFGVIIGGTTVPNVLAQDTPATTETPAQAAETDPEARFAEAYDSFVATLASELDADETAVDAAIRTALKEQVAALESEGRLDAEQVAEIQQVIDESDVPFAFGMGGPGGFVGRGGMRGFGGHDGDFKARGGEHRGEHGHFDGRNQRDTSAPDAPASDITPATLPSSGTTSGQSAPLAPAPAVNDPAF